MRLTYLGESVPVQRLDAIVAVRSSAGAFRTAARLAVLKDFLAAPMAGDDALPITPMARRVFANAGYLIREAPAALEAKAFRASARRGPAVLPVYVDPAWNTLLGTRAVTLKLPDDLTPAQARARIKEDGLTVLERLPFGTNLYSARLPPDPTLDEAVDTLQENGGYEWVEPVFLQVLRGRRAVPDPARQWHHENDGSAGQKGCDVRTPAAWRTTRGEGVRIAVIDNGMQVNHPDLDGAVTFSALLEPDGRDRVRVELLAAEDFPDDSHGTFCLGMAGARRNNGLGGCGSAPEAELMALACARDQVGTQLTLAKAVAFAADPSTVPSAGLSRSQGAHVLACSLGAQNGAWRIEKVLQTALTEAARNGRGGRGMPIFWAVANARTRVDQDEVCSHQDVIAVGASGPWDIRGVCASGPGLAFVAPGVDVFSTCSGGRYGKGTGSSYACPLAAGVAALVLAQFPEWTREQVRRRLESTCDPIGGPTIEYGRDRRHDAYGHGRINADRALHDPVP
jgi:thermitase